jgi:hypothetical protein
MGIVKGVHIMIRGYMSKALLPFGCGDVRLFNQLFYKKLHISGCGVDVFPSSPSRFVFHDLRIDHFPSWFSFPLKITTWDVAFPLLNAPF